MGISGELHKLLENYLSGRLQRVVLNGQTSSWRPVMAGVPQGSIFGPLLFLIYINDLPNVLKSNAKLFADDTSLFTIVKDKNESTNVLNNDLSLISKWAYDWKMLFNPDPKKPAQESIFSRKKQSQSHPIISLNNTHMERASYQRHLGIILDEKLYFKKYVDNVILKVDKGISVIQGTSREKIYKELGLESLKNRRWYKRLCCMLKIMNEEAPKYLTNILPKCQQTIATRNSNIPTF